MSSHLEQIESLVPAGACSRAQFQEQRAQLQASLREVGRAALQSSEISATERRRAESSLEQEIEQLLQVLIVRAKGMVSQEMLTRHQREIAVDEIPDYAVTHLLAELGEQELRSRAS